MKTIAQLLELKDNPYYDFTPEEKAALDAFLSKKSEQPKSQKDSSKASEKNIPATVHNKNIVRPETGVVPIADNRVEETEAVEELIHPDAVD